MEFIQAGLISTLDPNHNLLNLSVKDLRTQYSKLQTERLLNDNRHSQSKKNR